MLLVDLPDDVVSIIQAELQPKDYLALSRVSKGLYARYRQDPFYWRTVTATTFRLPISPLLAADGARWYWLYKRLKTQTCLYTWGQGLKGNLGPGRALILPIRRGLIPRRPNRHPRETFQRTSSSWPTETHVPDEVGVIADLQCGGWSTTILSAEGKLYTVGSLDSLHGNTIGETSDHFKNLEYLTQSTSAIRNFSSGRRHILALTDDGEILSWDRVNAKGLKIFSRNGVNFGGKPTRVAAGWEQSSAYIPETGVVYWTPVKNDQPDDMLDGVHVKEKIIPNTAHQQREKGHFEVTKHVVLERFIIWITSDSKLYACAIRNEAGDQLESHSPPFEVPGYAAEGRELRDLQGQFHNFGVFTASGDVLAGNVDYLSRCASAIDADPSLISSGNWSSQASVLASRPHDIPALQHTGVVALSYGDHHYHALHADGKITSYGTDSQSCGSLGLGGLESGARFRGLRFRAGGGSGDAELLPIAEQRGRQVWFEPEKKDWLRWLEDTIKTPTNTHEGRPLTQVWNDNPNCQAAFSEWVEQEGRHWSDGPNTTRTASSTVPQSSTATITKPEEAADYHHLSAYFAVAIAAAGWHSGALVLVDEGKAHETRSKYITTSASHPQPVPGQFESTEAHEEYVWKAGGPGAGFPRVRLPDGTVMPGGGEERPWRDGMPAASELGLGLPAET